MAEAIPPYEQANPFTLAMASAGSGKTFQLVHRFIGVLLANGPDAAERVLAATFTRAAAGEIVDRILDRLAWAVLDPRRRRAMCAALECGDLSDAECERLLTAVLRRLGRLRVGTIDAFLIGTARSFAPELGLSHGWTVLDEADQAELATGAVDELLGDALASAPRFAEMCALLTALNEGAAGTDVLGKLVEHLSGSEPAFSAGPATAWEAIAPETDPLSDDALAELAGALVARLTPDMPVTGKGAGARPNGNWVNAVQAIAKFTADRDWSAVARAGLVHSAMWGDGTYYRAPIPPSFNEAFAPLVDHVAATFLLALAERNRSTQQLLAKFDAAYAAARGRRSGYRFDDVTRLLDDGRVTDSLDEVYYRLDGRIDHVLLDEFQDTSVRQWRVVKPLVDELVGGGPGAGVGSRSFYCVGDVKQSLYGWRNAEPALLDSLPAEWPHLHLQDLLTSYRSATRVIDAVNAVFGTLSTNPLVLAKGGPLAAAAARTFGGWFKQHETVKTDAGHCRLITCGGTSDSNAAELQRLANEKAVERVVELVAAHPGATVGVLVRRKRLIAPLIDLLRRKDIDCAGEGGNPLTDDAAVCAALSMLHLVQHPSDSAAAYHVARSPLGTVVGLLDRAEDVHRACRAVRTAIAERGLAPVLDAWRSAVAAACNPRNFARFAQLVEMAHGFDADPSADLDRFVHRVRVTNVEDRRPARVKVMTIHASKGRQFRYVVLPDLDGSLLGRAPSVLVDRPDLLGPATCITVTPRAEVVKFHPRLVSMDEAWRHRQAVEELCTLYVAVTRAEVGLEMICHPQFANAKGEVKLPTTAAGLLRGALTDGGAAAPSAELWADGAPPAPEPAVAAEDLEPAVKSLRVEVEPAGRASRRRGPIAPSGLEGSGHVRLGDALSIQAFGGRDIGTVIHRWFEQVEWLDRSVPDDEALRASVADLAVPVDRLPGLIRQFRKGCDRPEIGALLRRDGYAATEALVVHREQRFAVNVHPADGGPTMLVQGQFDRVVVTRNAGRAVRAEVIDFKTDTATTAEDVRRLTEHYAPQVRAYRSAAAAWLGLPVGNVSARLAFVGEAGRVVAVE